VEMARLEDIIKVLNELEGIAWPLGRGRRLSAVFVAELVENVLEDDVRAAEPFFDAVRVAFKSGDVAIIRYRVDLDGWVVVTN